MIPEESGASTSSAEYAERLAKVQHAWWKRVLPVQAPYAWDLRRLPLGRVLDVGCGLGRSLRHVHGNGVGVDHNPAFVQYCRSVGLDAYTPEEFLSSPAAQPHTFDSLLLSHVIEHLGPDTVDEILETYLPYVRSGGYALFVTPQERGYRSDPTHVRFVDFDDLHALAGRHGLAIAKSYSFPFPRRFGELFIYNQFEVLSHKP
jgi:SAM-dependent methyltransferase